MIDHSELLPEGREIGGFRIEKAIGHGNMGIIYRAIQINLNRPVALKILFKSVAEDQDFVRSFFREAQAAAAFTHQNIVQAFDVGQSEDGIYYFAMELIEGGDISQQLKIRGTYSPVEALQYIVGIADGLDYGSNLRKLTHGDIKPANIMMTKSGKPKLADLGLARMGGEIQGESDGIMLTPLYAAPEMINGTWKVGDPRADMYSVGATLYHMISGQPPFYDPDYNKVIQMQLNNKHVPLTDLDPPTPAGVSKLVDKLLEKDQNKRFASWAEAKTAMEQAIKDPKGSGGKKKKKVLHYHDPNADSGEGQGESSGRSSHSRKKKKSIAPFVILAVVAVLLVGGFLFMTGIKKDMVGDEYAKLKKTFDGKKPDKIVKDIRNFIDIKKTVPDVVRNDLKKYEAMIKQRSLFYTSSLETQKKSIARLESSYEENPKKTAGFIKSSYKSIENSLDAPGKKKIEKNGLVFHAPFNGNGLNHISFYQIRKTSGRVVFGTGMIDKCADLKKTSVSYGDIPKLRFKGSSSFTISFWIKPANSDAWKIISKTENSSDGIPHRGYSMDLKDSQLNMRFFGNGNKDKMTVTCNRKMTANSWEHIIFIYSGKKAEFYINGAKVESSSTPLPNKDFSSTGAFRIGNATFTGSLDDVRIWDRKIDKKEISELYAHKSKTPLEILIHRYNVLKFKAYFTKTKDDPDPKNPNDKTEASKLKVHLGRLKSNFGNWSEINLTIAPILTELTADKSYQPSYLTFLKEHLPRIKKKVTSAFNSPAFNVIKGEKIESGSLSEMFFNRADTRKASFHKKHEIFGTISRNFYWDDDESVDAAAEILKLLQSKKLFPYDNPAFCTLAALILEDSEVELLIEEAVGSPYLELMKQIAKDRK